MYKKFYNPNIYYVIFHTQPDLVEKAIILDISPVSIPRDFSQMEKIFLAMKNISVPPNTSMPEGRAIVEKQIKSAVEDKGTVDFIMLNLKKLNSGEYEECVKCCELLIF